MLSDEVGFAPVVHSGRWAWGRSCSTPSSPSSAKRRLIALGHIQGWATFPPLIRLEQNPGPDRHPGCAFPRTNQMLELVPLFRRQPDLTIPPPPINTIQSQGS